METENAASGFANLSEPFIHRPVATTLLTAAIALGGAIAYNLLPGSAAAAGGFSYRVGQRQPSRRESGDHGVFGGHSARTSICAHRRGHGDDFHQHARRKQYHAAIRFESRYQRRRARRSGRYRGRSRLSAGESAEQSELSQGESGGRADFPDRADVFGVEQGRDVRRRVDHHGAEIRADSRRGAGVHLRKRAAGRARRAESHHSE